MMRRFLQLLRNQRGAAAVEFALAIPIAIILILGVMNFGIYLFFKNSVQAAVDEAARSATLYPQPDDAALTTSFQNALLTATSFGNAQIALTRGTTTDGRDYVDMVGTGSYSVNLVFFNLGSLPVRSTRRAYFQE
jgi:Flp pilus assembly protein TadG